MVVFCVMVMEIFVSLNKNRIHHSKIAVFSKVNSTIVNE
jgi:hypothetical protein